MIKKTTAVFILGMICSVLTTVQVLAQELTAENTVQISSISPDPTQSLKVGDTVSIEAVAKTMLKKSKGTVYFNIQSDDDKAQPIVTAKSSVAKGEKTTTFKESFVVPETSVIKVFTAVIFPGNNNTNIVDIKTYQVQK